MKQKEKSTREFLNTVIPDETIYMINTLYSLELKSGSTFKDALTLSLITRANNGEKSALKIVEKFGLK